MVQSAPSCRWAFGLNESPSQKEGKSLTATSTRVSFAASMKIPPKRKGNSVTATV